MYGGGYGASSMYGGYGASSYGGYGSSPYYSGSYGGSYGGGSMLGGGYGYGSGLGGGYNGLGTAFGGGRFAQPALPNAAASIYEHGPRQTFQALESVVHAVGGLAHLVESTYVATHSSVLAMV